MSCTPIPDGELAAVVTYLEMTSPPPLGDSPSISRDCPLSLRRLEHPGADEYRALFRLVGAPWLWFSRLAMADDELLAIIHDPAVELYAVVDGSGGDSGMVELDFREPGQCELAFIGLVPELTGHGHGRWLLAEALRRAWRDGVQRVHVHTCTLDHPAALRAYERAGFTACKRAVERFRDPRLLGILPLDCAPQVPVVGTLARASPPPDS
jgi:GNAT superfamily N-acetyltransferase